MHNTHGLPKTDGVLLIGEVLLHCRSGASIVVEAAEGALATSEVLQALVLWPRQKTRVGNSIFRSSIFGSFWSLKKIDRDRIALIDLLKRLTLSESLSSIPKNEWFDQQTDDRIPNPAKTIFWDGPNKFHISSLPSWKLSQSNWVTWILQDRVEEATQ